MIQSPRLLILITDLERGGTPTIVREVSTRLAKKGHDVEVACLSARGPVAEEIERQGVKVTALGATGVFSLGVIPRLIRLIRDRGVTTVYSLLVHANAVAAVASRFCGETRFIQSIQTTQARPRWHWPVQMLAALKAECVIVPTESVADVARDRAAIPREKIRVIPNAIEPAEFEGIKGVGSHYLKTPAPFNLGFIGRLDPVKRIPDLVEAVGIVGESVQLHIYGDGSERARIEAMVERLRLTNVTLHGAIARPQEGLREIDLLVLPSEAEGFGLVLIEAMAAKVPVVATDAPGIRDIVRNESTGLLVPVGSPRELAAAIERIQSDQKLREKLVEQAYADVVRRFAWEPVISEYEAMFF